MDFDGNYKKTEYLGKVYMLDSETKKTIQTGQGRFDTVGLRLETNFPPNDLMEQRSNLMVVLETTDGYFAPLVTFTDTFIPFSTSRRNFGMQLCLHWKNDQPLERVLDEFVSIDIQIKAKHESIISKRFQSEDKSESSEEIIIKGVRRELGSSTYKSLTVSANSGFGTSFSHDRVDNEAIMRRRLRYKITRGDGKFTLHDLKPFQRAFQSHWLLAHDLIDCEITSISLDGDVELIIANRKLAARASNLTGYQSALSIDDPLKLENLAKLMHFYSNPKKSKDLGSSSKIGLALARMIGFRFEDRHGKLDYEVIDLVFSLQSIAESVAEKEVSKQNKASRSEILAGIEKVMDALAAIEGDLPENVKQFYKKDTSVIYGAIARPSFTRSLEITAAKLDVDLTNYQDILRDIEKARRQVVHSEGYDAQFLVELLTKGTVTEEKSEDGKTTSFAFGVRKGALEHLYDLVMILLKRYIEKFAA